MVEFQLNLFGIIYFLGAIQGFFLFFLFFLKKRGRKENMILAILMLFYAIFLFESGLIEMPLSMISAIVITISVGVWNAYGCRNVPQYFWNEIDNEKDVIYQWSMLPIFGLEFEF